ncbi:MAG TPA: FIST N-terminal domain-containing protein [Candidatus Thiothrix moscowensis]|uniref:FIST signal transduction protein n=1 Tax=unclassified Thiothrix TaxID=2636184 RepID=UPI0025D0E0EB|nr:MULTISPECIES: FIST N-terminal domain-containing protein [unclassified Thiothrix]HRJ51528.1 FIST N-terminal domain-containing protein [Candidatus Thiothrix moscowensis]HRJ91843.1 FIST N-terminal domain-containing protein [Candidatus Thiothrix moscowensis]
MLSFHSASTRMVNSKRAITECMEAAFGEGHATDCDLLVIYASMGHNFQHLLDQAHAMAPGARIVGASCCGIVGKEGVSESMKDVAIMAVRGAPEEISVAHVDGILGSNSYEKGKELGRQLKAQHPGINMVYFLASGIDIANDRCIAGIESQLNPGVTIFGATSADNMKGVISFQFLDNQVYEHAAIAVGFADPTLEVVTRATHGFLATGEPMEVTRAEGHRIIELDGRPAWEVYTERLGLDASATCGDTIPIGALAEELPEHLKKEYGNDHILRVVTKRSDDGVMYYTTECPQGTKLWLTVRDEELIFSEMNRMMEWFAEQGSGRTPVAVFHADCLARGRFLFSKVIKDELVHCMQHPLSCDGEVPPWLGIYGFGEFAKLGGVNTYHNYTTAIYALYRR